MSLVSCFVARRTMSRLLVPLRLGIRSGRQRSCAVTSTRRKIVRVARKKTSLTILPIPLHNLPLEVVTQVDAERAAGGRVYERATEFRCRNDFLEILLVRKIPHPSDGRPVIVCYA